MATPTFHDFTARGLVAWDGEEGLYYDLSELELGVSWALWQCQPGHYRPYPRSILKLPWPLRNRERTGQGSSIFRGAGHSSKIQAAPGDWGGEVPRSPGKGSVSPSSSSSLRKPVALAPQRLLLAKLT